eukprot:GHRR01019937.1.p1 GENE.GHRR01019937.1~~GHRR01019937.1.p1  ORF type:complete len:748 (+),score=303.12 GHRR01019937.1:256-2499(+)
MPRRYMICRIGADKLAAAQQQRHQQQQYQQHRGSIDGTDTDGSSASTDGSQAVRSAAGRRRGSGQAGISDRRSGYRAEAERSSRTRGKSVVKPAKRSKSVEVEKRSRQPWSPRQMVERTVVNFLETTSSFSFKAAALLEGLETKTSIWQQGLSLTRAFSSTGSRSASGQQQQAQLGRGSLDSREGGRQQQQQGQLRPSAEHHRLKHSAGPQTAAMVQPGTDAALPSRASLHSRSKSLSSIQSGVIALGMDDLDNDMSPKQGNAEHRNEQQQLQPEQQQQQQQQLQALAADSGFKSKTLHRAAMAKRGSEGSICKSPFAQDQPDTQKGLGLLGFGSALSLNSHPSDNNLDREIEGILAAAAAGDSPARAAVAAAKAAAAAGDSPAAAAAAATAAAAAAAQGTGVEPMASYNTAQAHQREPTLHPQPFGSMPAHSPRVSDTSTYSIRTNEQNTGFVGHNDDLQVELSGLAANDEEEPIPPFLDMVPWYSGTSADLFKTMFDLMISLKLFLGRFDMRTMQAATAASMADSFNDTPAEGDGFTYEHLHSKQELWFDFIADTGDGGNSTYAVARALAAPKLTVPATGRTAAQHPQQQHAAGDGYASSSAHDVGSNSSNAFMLPRGDVLLIGGDLAYPNPSRETFEQRLFVPFQEAMPPPPHYHPGRLVVHKPDLPPAFGVQEGLACHTYPSGLSPRSSRYASVAALKSYSGPNVFAIPGNHDWIDGLETFIKQIMHKGWLGGWLMPQVRHQY